MANVKIFEDKQTDKQTGQKLYAPDLLMWGALQRRKCWLPAFTTFPILFSKAFYLRVVKTRDSMVTSLTLSQTRNFRHFQIESVCRRQFQI